MKGKYEKTRIVRMSRKVTRSSTRKKQGRKVKNDMLFCPRDKAIYLIPFKEFKKSNDCRKSISLHAKFCCRRSCRISKAKLVTSFVLYTSKLERTQLTTLLLDTTECHRWMTSPLRSSS